MPELTDISNNLYCININNDINSLSKAVSTYETLNSIYRNKGCPGTTSSFVFDLTNKEISSSGSQIQGSCNSVKEVLTRCDAKISDSSVVLNSQINNDYNTYVNVFKNKLQSNYGNLVSYRNKLDLSAKQIMGLDDSLYEKQNILDSAVFTTLLWTALATSVLYYAFTKL